MRRIAVRTALPLAATGLLLTGIGLAVPSSADMPTTAEGELVRNSTLLPGAEQLPVGAWARVRSVETGSGMTVVTLHVRGLAANATYGAHAHYRPCGPANLPLASGAHYQNFEERPGDQDTASTNPLFANPDNEIWLDLTTNDEGSGRAQTVVDWQFRGTGPVLRSVVIHVNHTSHGGTPAAGNAGARLGCLSAAF